MRHTDIPKPGGGAMPGAPLEPGKALKEGGGPYGFPGAVKDTVSIELENGAILGIATRSDSPPYGLYAILASALLKVSASTVLSCHSAAVADAPVLDCSAKDKNAPHR